MISELENFGKMEISGILTDLSAPVNSQRPSASSPHDNNATVPPPHIPVSICLCSAYLCVHTKYSSAEIQAPSDFLLLRTKISS